MSTADAHDRTEAGLAQAGIQARSSQLAAERWHKVSEVVLATTTGPWTREQLMWAGVLHAGPGSAIGGLTALAVHGLRTWHRDHVTVLVAKSHNLEPVPGVEFAQLDFLDEDAPARLRAMLNGPADVVLCDMAANTIGHRKTDHLKIVALVEAAADFAREVLAPGGAFLAKVIQGGTEGELLASLKRDFASVKHVKPPASRPDSAELYVLATGFRG